MKNTIIVKNVFNRFISRLDTAEERTSEPEEISIETSKTEKKMEKLKRKIRTEHPRMAVQLQKV